MTVSAAVVRWVVVVAVVWTGTAAVQSKGVVDISRCSNSCSSVPEDLWPSCCEAHNTCCHEFAESCMHDCLPRVHTGDVSVVEERPGMCCALYNLCCFRETFRISSSRDHKQVPASFPIVHRFLVQQPSADEASRIPGSRPPPRPSAGQQFASQDQDSPRRPNLSRLQLSKKPFRPERPDGLNKLPGDDGDNTDDSKKPRSRPKLPSFLANRKFGDQGEVEDHSEFKVTRRPAGSDIRQEIQAPEVGTAEPMGARRLDASINPVVTRKRLLLAQEGRQAARTARLEAEEEEGPRGRNLQGTPAREGRKLSVGRSSTRPAAPQQASARAQAPVVAAATRKTSVRVQAAAVGGQENPRPSTRRPTQAPPSPPVQSVQDETPKITIKEKETAAPTIVQEPEPTKESKSPAAEEETNKPADSIISAVEEASTSPEQSPAEKENHMGEEGQPEVAVEKVPQPPAEAVEKTKAETDADTTEPEETPAKTAFTPPEIVVNTPEEPKVEESADTNKEPTQERAGSTRSRGSTRTQSSGTDASQSQTQTQGRSRSSSRSQSGDRTTSRTANQATVRGASSTARQSQVRNRSRTTVRSQAEDEAAPTRTSRTRG